MPCGTKASAKNTIVPRTARTPRLRIQPREASGNTDGNRSKPRLAKAKGTLKAIGTYSRDDGTFQVKVTGTLTK